jgi:glycosyltransferase involved in cell wall biosynthesis
LKISILTPSYNSADYIERAIQSVLLQDYNDWEHIIVDGGSSDGTIDILKKHDHLKWISESDHGQSDAMNKAFKMCSGDIVAYLNADDWYEPKIFGKVIVRFNQQPDVAIFVGNLIMHEDGNERLHKPEASYKSILFHFQNRWPNNPISYFYKRIVQETVGDFPVNNHYTMDLWFLLRAFKRFRPSKIDITLGHFLLDGRNKTSTINPIKECRKTVIEFTLTNDPLGLTSYIYHYVRRRYFN